MKKTVRILNVQDGFIGVKMTTYIFIGISNEDIYVLLFHGGSFLVPRKYAVPVPSLR